MNREPARLGQAALLCIILTVTVPSVFGWGEKGHQMCARVAAGALPSDMPEFFRAARERLAYLCPEPDRWFTQSSQALQRINAPDHYFDLEAWGADAIPQSRYDLVLAAVKKGIVGDNKYVSNLGTAPVAISELAGKLVANFRQWREADPDSLARRQIEESIIYNAGIVAHYVTDLAQPLHCTVHFNGWAEGYPNPNKFPGGRGVNIHSRFEINFVDKAVPEKDIASRVAATPHRLGQWVPDMEQFIRRNNGFVEQLYMLDQKGAFGSGSEPAEAQAFTAARLADGATMLRDLWYSAWAVSGEEWMNDRVFVYSRAGATVLELLRENHKIETRKNGDSEDVVAIGNRKNGLDGRKWRWYLNNQPQTEDAARHVTAQGERIDWRFEKAAASPSTPK